MASGNVKMDFWIWRPDKSYYRDQDGTYTSNEERKKVWPNHLRRICDIDSIEALRLNLEKIKRELDTGEALELEHNRRPAQLFAAGLLLPWIAIAPPLTYPWENTRHPVDYNYSVEGLRPCSDDAPMDRIIFADINLASDPKRLDALFNKWGRLAESLFNGELGADVKCITINVRIDRHKIFVWTTKDLSRDALVEIRDKCQEITNRCERQIKLVWGPKDL
ncbi:hypothetical protein Ddc_24148 [Ditylenchus destructor]|nr:hypothetical protein Ddc_24148 [Ditylenchus destructor]